MRYKMIVKKNNGNDEVFECDTINVKNATKNPDLIFGVISIESGVLIIKIDSKIVRAFAPGSYLEYKLEESQESSNIKNMPADATEDIETLLSGVTEEIFQAFRHGGSDQWLQIFSNGRINIESDLTSKKTSTETPMIKLQCRADIFLLSEFKKMIQKHLEKILKT